MIGWTFSPPPQIATCPYCGTGKPQVAGLGDNSVNAVRGGRRWGVFTVTCCGGLLLAIGPPRPQEQNINIIETLYPSVRIAAAEIPDPARRFLQQAMETLNAPDAAAVMAGSAVDAMLKHFKLTEGSVYKRIDEAVNQNILTPAMGDWAHEVRLGANRPRHSDQENPHVSPQEAQQSVEFAEALAHFLFVLSSRVKKGIENAKTAK
jgi:Domain of unknown function (DUF4145)